MKQGRHDIIMQDAVISQESGLYRVKTGIGASVTLCLKNNDGLTTDDVYKSDQVFLPGQDITGKKFVSMLANFTMAINPWQAQEFQVYGIQANSCPGAPNDCVGPACNTTQPVH